ncbi:MAG: hypothetical protein KGZ83_16270 [Sulfuricella sp.]|nr:hypothetical protein [Sulfuricella sp.]
MSESPFEARLKAAYGDVYENSKQSGSEIAPPLRTESVMQMQEKVITVNVYVLGINIEYNEPDIFVTHVTCTEQEYYEEGLHLIMAEERAKQNGFVDPMFSFDERERNVIGKLGRLFSAPLSP